MQLLPGSGEFRRQSADLVTGVERGEDLGAFNGFYGIAVTAQAEFLFARTKSLFPFAADKVQHAGVDRGSLAFHRSHC
ncbi:hypothetical protein METH_20960 [Leisingera methylohalidivorans DSM 14336]|uniref:Uncharacterized protein n=1 Tax=Leisingera methylohalidivorans DSM 14336 TaxID=999552 RepID=V9VZW6_9RHOB|nr:hypothetical protein METH_20960 [Leisingera methylohalidivorans DSM 14336]